MFDYTSSERSFFMPVNVRGRLSPPMPEVFGNAVVLTVAKLDIRRLADCSVGEIALKLRENKANITPEVRGRRESRSIMPLILLLLGIDCSNNKSPFRPYTRLYRLT